MSRSEMAYCAKRIFSGILISKFNCEPVIANHDGDGSENEAKLLRSKT